MQDVKEQICALLVVCAAQDNLTTVFADSLAKRLIAGNATEVSYDPNLETR